MLRGKIDLGGSLRPLGGVLGRLGAISRCLGCVLGASEGHLGRVLRRLIRDVWRRFEASRRPLGGGHGMESIRREMFWGGP